MGRLNKEQRDTLLHQASLLEEAASKLETLPNGQSWTRWPRSPHLEVAGVIRQVAETIGALEEASQ